MNLARSISAARVVRGVAKIREVPLRARIILERRTGRGPLAVFLPCRGREGASLLRIYAIAGALQDQGWRTAILPWRLSLRQRHRILATARPDVLVMQGVRHDMNRPALYPGAPIIMDMDDADFHLPHLREPLRRAMPDLAGVIAGSSYVAEWCLAAGAPEADVVWTGMAASTAPRPPQEGRPPVVAWAQTRPMTYRREAEMVRQVMAGLASRHPDVRLRLYDREPGDDPGFAGWFESAGITVEWQNKSRFRDYIRTFDDVSVGLAPLGDSPFSRGKSFGKVLAYLDRHVPVICSAAGEHGRFFEPDTGVVSNDPAVWIAAADRLLAAPIARQAQAEAAYRAFEARLSLRAAAQGVEHVLTRTLDRERVNLT